MRSLIVLESRENLQEKREDHKHPLRSLQRDSQDSKETEDPTDRNFRTRDPTDSDIEYKDD